MPSIFIGILVAVGLGIITVILVVVAVRLLQENGRLTQRKLQLEQQNKGLAQQLQANDRRLRDLERQQREAEDARLREIRLENLAHEYRKQLRNDKQMANLQILTMSWKIEIINIYVQLRLYREQQRIDRRSLPVSLLKAEQTQDPMLILHESRLHMERLAKDSFSPVEAIQQYQHCLIMGDPGAGKTTLLKYLALKSASRELPDLPDLPIHIDLNVFASQSTQQNLLEFAADKWEASYGFPREDALFYMQKRLREGSALLLLDALDETLAGTSELAESSYERVCAAVDQLAIRYPAACIVVTVRTAGYQQRPFLHRFIELELLDFSLRDVEQFIENWFGLREGRQRPDLAKNLKNELKKRQHARILSLASNPLLLALIVFLYEQEGKLPDRRANLYVECVQLLLYNWERSKNPEGFLRRLDLGRADTQRLLQYVAWQFHQQGQRYFREHDLLLVIERFLAENNRTDMRAEDVLKDTALATDLLKEQAHGWYGFFHLTLQEYFVALHAIVMQQDGFYELLKHVGESWWEEVILLYAGSVIDASPLLQQLKAAYTDGDMEEQLFHQHLILAGRCVAANPAITREPQLRQVVIDHLFRELDITPYTLIRQYTSEVLAEIGGEHTHERLLSLFHAEERENLIDIQIHVARALVLSSGASQMDEVQALIVDERIPARVRGALIQALGEVDTGSSASILLPLASNNRINAEIRLDIANIFGQIIDEHTPGDAMAQLQSLLLSQHSLPRSTFASQRDFEIELRCSLLESFFTTSIIDKIGGEAREQLMELLWGIANMKEGRFFPMRWRAAVALAVRGEEPALSYLIAIMADKRQYGGYPPYVRVAIATALAAIRLPKLKARLVQELLPLLTDEQIDAIVRVAIVGILEVSGDHSLIPALFDILGDADVNQDVRIAVAHAFGALGERRHCSMLYRLRIPEESPFYRSILNAICRLGVPNVVSKLLPALTDKEVTIDERLAIIETLGLLPAPAVKEFAVVSYLMQVLLDQEVEVAVRQATAATLAQMTTDSSTARQIQPELERLLETDRAIRDEVHRTLWSIRHRDSDSSTGRQKNSTRF